MLSILLPLFKTESKWIVKTNLSKLVAKARLLKLKVRVALHKLIGKRKLNIFGGIRFNFNLLVIKSTLMVKGGMGNHRDLVGRTLTNIDYIFF